MQELREPQNDIHREARMLLRGARVASLAVIEDDYPSVALVTPAVTLDAAVILLLSQLSAHTRALDRNPRCALMVSGPAAEINPQTSPRLSLVCDAARSDDAGDRARYLAIHPYAAFYAGFGDFGIYRLEACGARYVGGFARAATLDIERLAPATDALRNEAAAARALDEANRHHSAALDAAAVAAGQTLSGWRAIALDPDGCDLARDDIVQRIAFRRTLRVFEDFIAEISAAPGSANG